MSSKELLVQVFGRRVVVFHPELARIAGGATAGLLLSQAFYWTGKGQEDGWFWKTKTEWQEETCLTMCEQDTARKALEKKGILKTKRAGVPARLFYKLDLDRIEALLQEDAPQPEATLSDQDVGKASIQIHENLISRCGLLPHLLTESTPEMIQEMGSVASLSANYAEREATTGADAPSPAAAEASPAAESRREPAIEQETDHRDNGERTARGKGQHKPRVKRSQAVMVYHDVTHIWPNTTQAAAMDAVILMPEHVPMWKAVLEAWTLRGFSPKNVTGMLDWFAKEVQEKRTAKKSVQVGGATWLLPAQGVNTGGGNGDERRRKGAR